MTVKDQKELIIERDRRRTEFDQIYQDVQGLLQRIDEAKQLGDTLLEQTLREVAGGLLRDIATLIINNLEIETLAQAAVKKEYD